MKKTIRDFDLCGKKVVMRCDFNVSIKNGSIIDDTRITSSIPTIEYALSNGAKLILLAHLGRVKTTADKAKNSLEIVYKRLNELLNGKVRFIKETRGLSVTNAVLELQNGEALLLENTRFEDLEGSKESKNDLELAQFWANLGEIYINDAFGTLHRAHASNVGISKLLDNGIGFLVEKELNELDKLDDPEKPFVIIMGGAKVSDKIEVINSLLERCNKILIGGGMAFTFLKAKGINVGKSIVEEDYISYCQDLLDKYSDKIVLPVDFKVALEMVDLPGMFTEEIKDYQMALDIGPKTIKLFADNLKDAKTCFWNGPLGMYEFSNYKDGTVSILKYLAELDCYIMLGGGDIVSCAVKEGFQEKVSFLSTGGGASLEYLVNKNLPGLEYIKER